MTPQATQTRLYHHLAELIEYPNGSYHFKIEAARQAIETSLGPVPELSFFFEIALRNPPDWMEEEYIRTFDFNPDCALEIGWHLYGENYGRGDFLVKMRDLLKRFDIPEGTELPDHLGYILRAFDCLRESEAREFAGLYVLPGLKKLMAGINKKVTPYQAPLVFIERLLTERFTESRGGRIHGQP